MGQFTDEQMMSVVSQNPIVRESYERIRTACRELQNETGCPDEDIDTLLSFLIGRWQESTMS